MTPIPLGIMAASLGASNYFISTYGDSQIGVVNQMVIDSAGNPIAFGQGYDGSYQTQLVSLDPFGVPRFAKRVGGSGNDIGYGIALDSSDNIYTAGYHTQQTAGSADAYTHKYDSSGNLLWQKRLGSSSEDEGRGIAATPNGDLYIVSWGNSGYGGRDFHIHKRNSSGTLQWQRGLGSVNTDYSQGIAVDNSGNSYSVGYTSNVSFGGDDAFVFKYNSSGTIQFQKRYGGSGNDYFGKAVVDSSGNPIFVGSTQSSGQGSSDALIVKADTNGVPIWKKTIGDAGSNYFIGVNVDSADNIIAVGANDNNNMIITKWDTNGNLLLQRNIDAVGVITGQGVAIDANDDWYIGANTNGAGVGNYDQMFLYLPGDGSKTGTYVLDGHTYTYSASSLVVADATGVNYAATSFSEGSTSWTDGTTTYGISNWNFTQYITSI